jgi:MurNAc alpha-1-phosphate uridylyltransferase
MGDLTLEKPKPMLEVAGEPLIIHTLGRLKMAGIREVVINLHYMGSVIEESLADGSGLGMEIQYSRENQLLDSGGGIKNALPLLDDGGNEPFLVVNADVWTDLDFSSLDQSIQGLATLIMVPNPEHHPAGDFLLDDNGRITRKGEGETGFTYSGVGIVRPELFELVRDEGDCFPLRLVFERAIAAGQLYGEIHRGQWLDVGTPERYMQLVSRLR